MGKAVEVPENDQAAAAGGPAIGIDLGTTYSCVAVWQNDEVEVITNDQGKRTTPSYVSFSAGERSVGETAKANVAFDPRSTIYDVKRLIGRRFSDQIVQNDLKLWPFHVVAGPNDRPNILVNYMGQEKKFAPEEISSMVLMKMKDIAERYLGCKVNDAVITVPAYFSDSQRRFTKVAGAIAGLNVKRIMDEPTAAALAYGFDKISDRSLPKNIFVFDLGGGTLDVSLVTVSGGLFEVKATAGDTHLGGEDFDTQTVNHFVNEIKRKYKKDIRGDARALNRLRIACEKAKKILSTSTMTCVSVDCLFDDVDISFKFSRTLFEQLNKDLFFRCFELVDQCLNDAKIEKNYIDIVVPVGGSSRIPKVRELLETYFGASKLRCNINPEEAVAHGAAIQAANLCSQGNEMFNDLVLVDVTPLSLGLQLDGDVMSIVIPRNTPIPTRKEDEFTTSGDHHTFVEFPIYEGERPRASHNNLLGEFKLSGISPALKLVPKIDVCFEVDADGILHVLAKDRDSGQANDIIIINDESLLRKEEIDRMIRDAEKYKAADEKHQKKVDARGELNNYACMTRNITKSNSDYSSLPKSKRQKLKAAIGKAIRWLDGRPHPSVAASKAKLQKLREICEPIIQELNSCNSADGTVKLEDEQDSDFSRDGCT